MHLLHTASTFLPPTTASIKRNIKDSHGRASSDRNPHCLWQLSIWWRHWCVRNSRYWSTSNQSYSQRRFRQFGLKNDKSAFNFCKHICKTITLVWRLFLHWWLLDCHLICEPAPRIATNLEFLIHTFEWVQNNYKLKFHFWLWHGLHRSLRKPEFRNKI